METLIETSLIFVGLGLTVYGIAFASSWVVSFFTSTAGISES